MKNQTHLIICRLLICVHFFLIPVLLYSLQSGDTLNTKPSILDLLPTDNVAELNISTDFALLEANRKTDNYQPGNLSIKLKKENILDIPMQIKCRGKFRRMRCDFPPLKLKFKKSGLKERNLAKSNELKLTTHCLDDRALSRNNIIREYLAYRLFALLSPYSFEVRLVRVQYKGGPRKMSKIKHYGILIEDEEDMAKRYDAKRLEQMGVSPESMHRFQQGLVSLYQYMISNADYSFSLNRNIQMIQLRDSSIVCIPYDFDFSRIVNASYAKANPQLGQKRLADRIYLGFPCSLEEILPILKYYELKKEEIISFVEDFKLLDKASRVDIVDYLKTFFEEIKDLERMAKIVSNPKGIR